MRKYQHAKVREIKRTEPMGRQNGMERGTTYFQPSLTSSPGQAHYYVVMVSALEMDWGIGKR